MKLLRVVGSLSSAIQDIARKSGETPVLWATTAKNGGGALRHCEARDLLERENRPFLLLFGTGWGLAPEIFDLADAVLEAIPGVNGYNHLPVRSAASILMDRLARTKLAGVVRGHRMNFHALRGGRCPRFNLRISRGFELSLRGDLFLRPVSYLFTEE